MAPVRWFNHFYSGQPSRGNRLGDYVHRRLQMARQGRPPALAIAPLDRSSRARLHLLIAMFVAIAEMASSSMHRILFADADGLVTAAVLAQGDMVKSLPW